MNTEKLLTIIREAKRFGTINQSDLPLVIEALEQLLPKEPTVPKAYMLTDDYKIEESTHEEALNKKDLTDAIREMIKSRHDDNRRAELKITSLRTEIANTDNEIKELNKALLSVPDLES